MKIDRETGMMQAMRHLQETGRKRIGLWLSRNSNCYSYRQRIAGYRKSNLGEEFLCHGLPLRCCIDEIRDKKLDAVIASNDSEAAQLARELMRRGIRIPEDVALIGHDNDDFSEFYYPSLSTIDQNDEAAGRKFFELLMEQLKGNASPGNYTFHTKLIIRESSSRKINKEASE